MTATASTAGAATTRTGPPSTRHAETMQPRYTKRNSAVGTATSAATLASRSP